MNRDQIAEIPGLEIVGEERKAYFFGGQVIAMEEKGVIAIMPTQDQKVSDIYNLMLDGTEFEHYLKDGVGYIVDPESNRTPLIEHFAIRIKETS